MFDKANDQVTYWGDQKHNSRFQLRRFEFTDLLVIAAKIVSKARLGSDYEDDL
jgi:hypothetical protein